MENFGKTYSAELGIDLMSLRKSELFKWFLASVLLGARISEKIAVKTYVMFNKHKILSPESIIRAGWDKLVEVLDEGGYSRYDFKTATKLLEISEALMQKYEGDLNWLCRKAFDTKDLESLLVDFKGVGTVTASIFLRELRGIWMKADPLPQDLAIKAAYKLGFTRLQGKNEEERRKILEELKLVWKENQILNRTFIDFETALTRYGMQLRRKNRL